MHNTRCNPITSIARFESRVRNQHKKHTITTPLVAFKQKYDFPTQTHTFWNLAQMAFVVANSNDTYTTSNDTATLYFSTFPPSTTPEGNRDGQQEGPKPYSRTVSKTVLRVH